MDVVAVVRLWRRRVVEEPVAKRVESQLSAREVRREVGECPSKATGGVGDGLVAVGRGSRGEENGLAFEEEGGGDGELGVRVRLGGESVNINWWEARGGAGVPVVGRRGAGRHFSTRSSFLRRRL